MDNFRYATLLPVHTRADDGGRLSHLRRHGALAAYLVLLALAACGGGSRSPGSGATYSISGTVSGPVTAGVAVSLHGAATKSATTDGSGNYTFGGLANGNYTVAPSMSGYTFAPASVIVTLTDNNVTGQDFTSSPAAHTFSISGAVRGASAAGITISLRGAATGSTLTDASGQYAFTGLAKGSYTVTPTAPGHAFSPSSLSVALTDADVTGQDFTANPAHSISGTVSGAVNSGVMVSLSGAQTATTQTDADGNYLFANLPDGDYTITPRESDLAFSPPSLSLTVNGADVTAQDFTALATYGISGYVEGAVMSGVTVSLSGAATATATTNDPGVNAFSSFSFMNLGDGSYTVTPNKTGCVFWPAARYVTISAADLTLIGFTSFSTADNCRSPGAGATATIDCLVLSRNTIPIEGSAFFYFIVNNRTSDDLTNVGFQGWVQQGAAERAAGGGSLVTECGASGVLPPGTCSSMAGRYLGPSNGGGGTGTLTAGPATAIIELTGDGGQVLDTFSVPITLTN